MRVLRIGEKAAQFLERSGPETRAVLNDALVEVRDRPLEDLTKRPSIRRGRYWFQLGGFHFLLCFKPGVVGVLEIHRGR